MFYGFDNPRSLETGESLNRISIVIVPDPFFFRPQVKEKKRSGYVRLIPIPIRYHQKWLILISASGISASLIIINNLARLIWSIRALYQPDGSSPASVRPIASGGSLSSEEPPTCEKGPFFQQKDPLVQLKGPLFQQ